MTSQIRKGVRIGEILVKFPHSPDILCGLRKKGFWIDHRHGTCGFVSEN
jgi:hypothetical protein